MAQENREVAEFTLGVTNPQTFRIWKEDLELIKLLFPSASFQLRNKKYAAICTRDHYGDRVDLYLRRIIVDLALRAAGKPLAKGYSVETRNGDPLDLRRTNLKVVTTAERLASGKYTRRNEWVTHHVIGIRLDALARGECPDRAMEEKALEWLSKQAANDNSKSGENERGTA